MKKFVTRNKIRINIIKYLCLIIILIISAFLTIKLLSDDDERKINNILSVSSNNIFGDINLNDLINFNLKAPNSLFKFAYNDLTNESKEVVSEVSNEPIIYIYNTHQTEEYIPGNLGNYNLKPTVYLVSNILKNELSSLGINSVVEEENIKDVLNTHNWSYKDSYKASRLWLNNIKEKYPNIKLYIDLHRDSSTRTITINGKNYAKMMFVIGMNHDNYEINEDIMVKLNNILNENYPGIMRNIFYAKNNRFNQDFDSNVILIEVGGVDNTINEAYESAIALSKAIKEYLGE